MLEEVVVELAFEVVGAVVVATVKFDDEPVAVAAAVELPVKQLTAVGTVTPLSPQICLAYAAATT